MELTLAQLAGELGIELRGDGNIRVSSVATLQRASEGSLSFLANACYRKYLSGTRASAVILAPQHAEECGAALLVSDNPYLGYARAAKLLNPAPSPRRGIHPAATIEQGCEIDEDAWIGPYCYLEQGVHVGPGVQIGTGCHLGAGVYVGAHSTLVSRVTVLAAARIGQRVILQPGVVIGSEGFGLAPDEGRWEHVPQLGSVRLGDDVEIGSNTCIDRGAIEDTCIEDGVKIDNLVQIGHNVIIGAHSAIAGCVGISGSARVGRYCTLAGGVGLVGHIRLADNVHITGMSMVTRSIDRPGTYSSGTPLTNNRDWLRNAVRIKQLDSMAGRLAVLEKRNADKGST